MFEFAFFVSYFKYQLLSRSVLNILLQGRIVEGNYLDKFPLGEVHEELGIENKKGNVQLATKSKLLAEVVYTKADCAQ